jgi:signal transduction histidine kinase
MAKANTSALARLDQLLDWFIPASMTEREPRERARMFLLSHIFGPFLGNALPLCMLILGFKQDYHLWVFFGTITVFWVFPFVLKFGGARFYQVLAVLSLQDLIFCILWACFSYGGIHSPFLPWLVCIPLLTFFYISPAGSLKYYILAMLLANIVAFGLLPVVTGIQYPAADLNALLIPGLMSTLSCFAYIAMMALYYASIYASQVNLEQIVRRHQATARDLRLTTEVAQRAGAAKSEFVANMSHELRTPLNAVIGYSQILLEEAEDEKDDVLTTDLHRILGSGHSLLRLVNDVLDYSKIEANKMETLPEFVSARAGIAEVVDRFKADADVKGLKLGIKIEDGLDMVHIDWTLARKALVHIVDNAVKFTASGAVGVRAWRRGEMLLIEVSDTGPGIAAPVLQDLFNAFSASGDVSETKYGGAGIGLALSEKICKLLGGRITVNSRVGEGSAFTLHLRIAPAVQSLAA